MFKLCSHYRQTNLLTLCSAGDLSRVETRGCRSPVGVSGVAPLAPRSSQSPPSSENINNLRASPDAPAEGPAPIKTEVINLLQTVETTVFFLSLYIYISLHETPSWSKSDFSVILGPWQPVDGGEF